MIPRVPHLPGSRPGLSDLVCSEHEVRSCRSSPVIVVEKLDGVAVEFRAEDGVVDVELKQDWKRALKGELRESVRRWAQVHTPLLLPLLHTGARLYGEWLWHRLVVAYDRLPSAVIFHGLTDDEGRLRPRTHTLEVMRSAGLATVEPLFRGVVRERAWQTFLPDQSAFGPRKAEGVVVEFVDDDGVAKWAKWVAPHYRQPQGKDLTGKLNRVAP